MVQYPPQGTASTENLVTLDTAQSITGAKTYNNTSLKILATGGQVYTIAGGPLGADKTVNLPSNVLTNGATFIIDETTQTITGVKTFNANITMADARDIVINTTTGTKIGTGTTQKLAFYNSTPIVQPTVLTAEDATAIDSTYDSVEEAVLNNVRTRLGEVETKLQALGLLA